MKRAQRRQPAGDPNHVRAPQLRFRRCARRQDPDPQAHAGAWPQTSCMNATLARTSRTGSSSKGSPSRMVSCSMTNQPSNPLLRSAVTIPAMSTSPAPSGCTCPPYGLGVGQLASLHAGCKRCIDVLEVRVRDPVRHLAGQLQRIGPPISRWPVSAQRDRRTRSTRLTSLRVSTMVPTCGCRTAARHASPPRRQPVELASNVAHCCRRVSAASRIRRFRSPPPAREPCPASEQRLEGSAISANGSWRHHAAVPARSADTAQSVARRAATSVVRIGRQETLGPSSVAVSPASRISASTRSEPVDNPSPVLRTLPRRSVHRRFSS